MSKTTSTEYPGIYKGTPQYTGACVLVVFGEDGSPNLYATPEGYGSFLEDAVIYPDQWAAGADRTARIAAGASSKLQVSQLLVEVPE